MGLKKRKKKKSDKPVKLITLDTETRGLFGEVFRIGAYDGNKPITTSDYEDVKTYINQYTNEYQVHIFTHNLDFDLAKLADQLVPGAKLSESIFINNNVAVFRSNNIILHDSLKILPSSLDKLSKDFKLEEKAKIDLSDHILNIGWALDQDGNKTDDKNKMDMRKSKGHYFENVDPEENMLNEYLINDNISLYEILNKILNISGLDMDEFIECPTTASLAMRVFKTNYPDDYNDIVGTNWRGQWGRFCEDFVRLGYYGGRTEVFKPFLFNGYHYDVNSLYPSVMKDHEFPVGYYQFFTGKKAEHTFNYWMKQGIGGGFAEVEIYVPEDMHIPPLPVRHKNKLKFPVGRLSGVWALPEIKNAIKYGCTINKIKQVLFFEKTVPVFQAFVEDFAEIKMNSEGAKRQFAKLMQNSLYGKFGMQRKRKTLLDLSDEEEVKKAGYPYVKYKHPLLKKEFLYAEIEVDPQYIQPHIAAYVTALARNVLYEGLVKQEDTTYCDTDSIACKNKMPDEIVDPKAYGKWDLENIVERGLYLQPKLYYEKHPDGETIKAKGIPGDIMGQFNEGTYNRIMDEILNGKERIEIFGNPDDEKNIIKGETKVRQKFATMLKNGEQMDQGQIIRKGINLRAEQKRKMDWENNTSFPHKIYQY